MTWACSRENMPSKAGWSSKRLGWHAETKLQQYLKRHCLALGQLRRQTPGQMRGHRTDWPQAVRRHLRITLGQLDCHVAGAAANVDRQTLAAVPWLAAQRNRRKVVDALVDLRGATGMRRGGAPPTYPAQTASSALRALPRCSAAVQC